MLGVVKKLSSSVVSSNSGSAINIPTPAASLLPHPPLCINHHYNIPVSAPLARRLRKHSDFPSIINT